jgi:hypothetical protein
MLSYRKDKSYVGLYKYVAYYIRTECTKAYTYCKVGFECVSFEGCVACATYNGLDRNTYIGLNMRACYITVRLNEGHFPGIFPPPTFPRRTFLLPFLVRKIPLTIPPPTAPCLKKTDINPTLPTMHMF